jgi:arsenate reductase-like glutaredoxin family protein
MAHQSKIHQANLPQRKTKDVITLFHKSNSPASTKVLNLLKQVSANVSEAATEDQASDHSAQTNPNRAEFDLDVTEKPPTPDQLMTIIDYVGNPSTVISGASTVEEALKKFKQDTESFRRPTVRTRS